MITSSSFPLSNVILEDSSNVLPLEIHKWYNDDQPHQDELTGATIIIKYSM
jgi:hypothetical protein